jgi:tetratricopeptide (TPR) repeat protein
VLSATGLIDLGVALQLSRKHEDADRQLLKAIEIARAYGANRVEMRAALQRASLRTQMGEGARALELVDEPDRYFQKTQDRRLQADAQAIRSRALELVDRYAEALPLTTDVLRFAEQAKDDVVEGNALENLASQLAGTGRHP